MKPFILIKGRFKPGAGFPDGDSVRFLAQDLCLWNRLEGRPVKLGTGPKTKNTAPLRFEGIDAIEKGATRPLATRARDNMLRLIGYDEVGHPEPTGYILARLTDDKVGRPICFVFAGGTVRKDGAEVWLDNAMLHDSVNYHQAYTGYAYPLYYNTLPAFVREELNQAIVFARQHDRGCWPRDRTTCGVAVHDHDDLAKIPPIWPKLWRRLDEFLRKSNTLEGFMDFLEQKNERVDILSTMHECGLEDVVKVQGSRVKMVEPPENLRVVARAGRRSR